MFCGEGGLGTVTAKVKETVVEVFKADHSPQQGTNTNTNEFTETIGQNRRTLTGEIRRRHTKDTDTTRDYSSDSDTTRYTYRQYLSSPTYPLLCLLTYSLISVHFLLPSSLYLSLICCLPSLTLFSRYISCYLLSLPPSLLCLISLTLRSHMLAFSHHQ